MKNKKSLITRTQRFIKLSYLKILRIDDPPEKIAKGAALGVFIGVAPTFGLGFFLSIAAAVLFKANKAAAVLGSFIMNPITAPFFWSLSLFAGDMISRIKGMSIMENIQINGVLGGVGWSSMVFLSGNFAVAIVFSLISYFLVEKLVDRYRKKRKQRILKQENF